MTKKTLRTKMRVVVFFVLLFAAFVAESTSPPRFHPRINRPAKLVLAMNLGLRCSFMLASSFAREPRATCRLELRFAALNSGSLR